METNWPEAAHPAVLSADEAHVHAVPLDIARAKWESLCADLSQEEQRRAERYQLDAPRRRFVVARAALRALLGEYLGTSPEAIAFDVGAQGKPHLRGDPEGRRLRFNIAHSGDLALIAVTVGCEVGVDVELLRPVGHSQQIAQRYFHPADVQVIVAAPPAARDEAFLRCWTGKEAVLKAVGRGISDSLAGFCVPDDDGEVTWIEMPMPYPGNPCRCWLQRIMPRSDYIGAVACVGAERHLRCFAFPI